MSKKTNITKKGLEEILEGLAKQVARNASATKIIVGDLHDLREDVDSLLDRIYKW